MPRRSRLLGLALAIASLAGESATAAPSTAPDRPRSPLTAARIAALPRGEREAWERYLAQSDEWRRHDEKVLARELSAGGLPRATSPPVGEDFKLSAKAGSPWFASFEARKMAEAAVSFQTPSGGWSKKVSMAEGVRKPGMHWSAQGTPETPWHYVGTFDNRATTEHLRLIAGVHETSHDRRLAEAFRRGLAYIFAAQYPNGGWPQVFPLEGGYHDDITFNDDAQVHVLDLLRDVAAGNPPFAFVSDRERSEAGRAVERGVRCILATQIRQSGRPTVWCAQHNPIDLSPVAARRMEPAALSGRESATIVEFLMGIPRPSQEIKDSINSALVWFERSRLPADSPIAGARWARFYDLTTNRPIFAGSDDGRIYDTFEAMREKNPGGYDYFTTKPRDLLTRRLKSWQKLLAKEETSD